MASEDAIKAAKVYEDMRDAIFEAEDAAEKAYDTVDSTIREVKT